MFSKNTDWEAFMAMRDRQLLTGEKAHGLLMRRKVNGEWEYRLPTPAEESDYVSGDGW